MQSLELLLRRSQHGGRSLEKDVKRSQQVRVPPFRQPGPEHGRALHNLAHFPSGLWAPVASTKAAVLNLAVIIRTRTRVACCMAMDTAASWLPFSTLDTLRRTGRRALLRETPRATRLGVVRCGVVHSRIVTSLSLSLHVYLVPHSTTVYLSLLLLLSFFLQNTKTAHKAQDAKKRTQQKEKCNNQQAGPTD